MVSTITDRLYGESSGVAVKAPVVAVTNGQALPLTGLTTVGSYAPSEGDRILVKDQADPTTNGIYNASVSSWQRSGDFDGVYDVVQGTLVIALTTNGQGVIFQLTTPDPVIGSTGLIFFPFWNPNVLYPQTPAEAQAGIAPPNLNYLPFDATRFGIDATGQTDSTTALQHALNAAAAGGVSIASGGAFVEIPNGAKLLINGNLTIPANVTLKGPQSFVGTMTSNSMSAPFHAMGGAIALKNTATITMDAGSCIDGLLIYQAGLTFPQVNAANYAGTAITYAGDDCTVQNCMVLGFNQAITSTGFQRPKCFRCLIDNNNGISFSGSEDITHIEDVHAWNFGTFYPSVPGADLQRSGTAFNVNADGSGAKLIDCFCFGYNVGYDMQGTGEVGQTLLNCWADNTSSGYGTGFNIIGGATDTKLTACQASGCIQGYLFSLSASLKATMTDCNAWGNTAHGILSGSGNAGDVIIRGGYLRNNPNAVSYSNTGGMGILDIDEVSFDNSDGLTFNVTVSTTNVYIGKSNNYGNESAGTQLVGTPANVGVASIASAGQISLPSTGDTFTVTGTTNISNAVFGWAGRKVTLIFTGGLTVQSNTGAYSQIRLSGGSNFTPVAGSTLTILHNGVQWYEVGRAA